MRSGPATPPSATPPGTRKKSAKGKWIGAALVLLLVVLYNAGKDDAKVAVNTDCESAFNAGSEAVTAGDLAQARVHALRARAVCSEGERGKADALQGAIAAAEKTDDSCRRSLRAVDNQIQDRRLARARTSLDGLTSVCAAKPEAEALRKNLNEAQAASSAALADVRSALEARDEKQARTALAALAGLSHDDPNLVQLKRDVDALGAELVAAAQAATAAEAAQPAEPRAPVAAPAPRTVDRSAAPVAQRNTEQLNDQKTAMVSVFLRDAEQALSQRKFDAAKTYVDSARHIDANDPRLDSLMQQIRDRERQMLQQETTIR